MSQDQAPTTRAEKRAARDAARAALLKRGTKRKADGPGEDEPQEPQAEKKELEQDFIALPPVNDPKSDAVKTADEVIDEVAIQSSRKERRAARDAERAEKFRHGKKRKLEEAGNSVGEGSHPQGDSQEQTTEEPTLEHDDKVKPAESKKRKLETQDAPAKKRKAVAKPVRKENDAETADGEAGAAAAKPPGKQRFIVFLGNLPYTTTDASLQTHFNSLKPFTLRHRTDPKTKKSKGFAFLEFEAFDRMKTCLKLYHHSYFDPEAPEKSRLAGDGEPDVQQNPWNKRGKKEKGRKINVELTAGGGGGKEDRKEKIRVKNVRLEEQRQRRAELEQKEGKKNGKVGYASKRKGASTASEELTAVGGADAEGMHPARLAMMGR